MRKSFFKKLSLGMALALVLGTTAHAGVAQAAEETWALKKNSKILYLNEDNTSNTKNFYDFNFKKLPENWKEDYSFKWASADEEVATVAAKGVVTAVSVGKTVITCTVTDKETKEFVAEVSADVTVKANAAEVVINNAADYGVEYGWFIPTGTTIDLDRTMFDENGNSTTKRGVYVSDYTRWLATDMDGNVVAEDVVAITANGEFTFNVAGSYYLWCETYQSAANPETTAYDYFAVTVADEEIEIAATQKTVDTFEITFSTALDAVEFVQADFEKALVVENADENTELVRKIELVYNEDKTLVTGVKVQLWNEFENGKVYTVTCGEVETTFTASVGKAASIVITVSKTGALDAVKGENIVYVTTDGKVDDNTLAINFLDAAGIDVTAKDRTGNVVFEYEGDVDFFDFDEETLKLVAYEDAAGKTLKITAKYVEVDDEGEDVIKATGVIVVTAKAAPASELTSINVNVIQKNDGTPGFDKDQAKKEWKTVATNDENLYIAVSAKDNWGNEIGNTGREDDEIGYFTFTVNNDQIAAVGERDGYFTAFAEGTVRVDIFYTDLSVEEPKAVRVARQVVTIKGDREASKLKVEDNSLDLVANVLKGETTKKTNIEQTATFKFTVEDNYGEAVTGLAADAFVITCDSDEIADALANANVVWNADAKVYELKVTNTDLIPAITTEKTVGKTSVGVSFTVALADNDSAAAQKKVTVTVKKPVNDTITSYTVEVADIDAGMKNTSDAKVDIVVYGLNSNGVKVAKVEALDAYVYGDMKAYVKETDGVVKAEELFNGATSGTALVYTITKGNTQVKAFGDAQVSVATGGSMKLVSGEVMNAVNTVSGSSIYLATTATGSNLVYTAKTGDYTVTVYEITKSVGKDGKADYKQVKKASDTFKVADNKMTINAKQVKTTASTASLADVELGKKLAWTDDATVKAIVTECYEFTLKDINEETTEAMDMTFEVRANGNNLYVKTVRIFKSVENGQYVVLEKELGKTITIAE